MKKYLILGIALSAILVGASSCKSKESAYKAAYLKAQEKETTESVVVENEVAPAPAAQERVSNERITIVDDDASKLKMYNVVVGSFSIKTNAASLKERLVRDGYPAILARNAQSMYRVIVGSYDTRNEATELRDAVKMKYSPEFSDAWLLINK